jgi:hypothetical protein
VVQHAIPIKEYCLAESQLRNHAVQLRCDSG